LVNPRPWDMRSPSDGAACIPRGRNWRHPDVFLTTFDCFSGFFLLFQARPINRIGGPSRQSPCGPMLVARAIPERETGALGKREFSLREPSRKSVKKWCIRPGARPAAKGCLARAGERCQPFEMPAFVGRRYFESSVCTPSHPSGRPPVKPSSRSRNVIASASPG